MTLLPAAPTITTSPRDADLTPGMGTFLNCTVSGFPSPRSSWFKTNLLTGRREELAVVGPTHVRYSNGLQLHNVGRDDNGMYQCVVHNALGMITNQATVRVGGEGDLIDDIINFKRNFATCSISCGEFHPTNHFCCQWQR